MDFKSIKGAEFIRFKKNDVILRVGERSNYFYYIVSGSCYRIKNIEQGQEFIMRTYSKGDIVCACLTYFNDITQSDFIAKTNMTVYRVPRQSFIDAIEEKPEIMKIFLEQVLQDYIYLSKNYEMKASGKTANLFCSFILERIKQNEEGMWFLSKEYTNVKLAMNLGIHEVTVNRILRVLKKQGVLEKNKNGIFIYDIEKLKDYAYSDIKIKY